MFERITVRSSRVLIEKSRKRQGDVEWDYRVSGSTNRGKSLYSIFEYQFRYMKARARERAEMASSLHVSGSSVAQTSSTCVPPRSPPSAPYPPSHPSHPHAARSW